MFSHPGGPAKLAERSGGGDGDGYRLAGLDAFSPTEGL